MITLKIGQNCFEGLEKSNTTRHLYLFFKLKLILKLADYLKTNINYCL